jgi:hypothetical protein
MVSMSEGWWFPESPAMPPTGVQPSAEQVALFPAMVLLVIVPLKASIPPAHVEVMQEALLPETVLFVSVNVVGGLSRMAPPDALQNDARAVQETVFAEMVLPAMVAVPLLPIPPPLASQPAPEAEQDALLPETMLSVSVNVPLLRTPPPLALHPPSEAKQDALLPETMLSVSVNVPLLRIPPPASELPFSMVRPEMPTVAEIEKTRLAWLPLTARTPAPGPVIVRLFGMLISPLVRVMSEQDGLSVNVMMFAMPGAATASRREPVPLSLQLVTVRVAPRTTCGAPIAAAAASRDTAAAHAPSDARPRIRTL